MPKYKISYQLRGLFSSYAKITNILFRYYLDFFFLAWVTAGYIVANAPIFITTIQFAIIYVTTVQLKYSKVLIVPKCVLSSSLLPF